ncbi:ATP-binding cassette sub-family F member 2 [Plecturocebus cupreus]
MLFLDEPSSHLDAETMDALAGAINELEGGTMLASHDFRLLPRAAREVWVCEKQTVTKRPGDILAYKEPLKSKLVDGDPSSLRGPATCEPSTWARVRSPIWELTAATLTRCSGRDPGATLLHCCNTALPASPLPSTCLSCTLLSTAGQPLSVSRPPSSYFCLDSAGRSLQPLAGHLTLSVMQSEAPAG